MKIKSALITQASGSIGGLTASRNRGGMYFRARATPVNPNTPQQQVIRGFVAQLASLWASTLTAAQRLAWEYYAALVYLPDALGEDRNVGGLGMYIRSNVPRLQAALPRVDTGPTIYNLGDYTEPTFTTFAAATDDFGTTFDNTDAWANEDDSAMLILSSRPQNQTINYFKGPYRYAGKIDGDAITPPTSPATISAAFAFEAAQRIFVQARISRADGRLSTPFRAFGLST